MNLARLLDQQAIDRPQQAAIIEPARRGRSEVVSFAQLHDRAGRAASLLHRAGVTRGDRVVILQPISSHLYVALLALWRLGAAAVFVDPGAGRSLVEACCRLTQPRAMIGSTRACWFSLICPPLRQIPRKLVIGGPLPWATRWSNLHRLPPHGDIADVEPGHEALLTFTSGSTGAPKCIVRTHGFLAAQHRALADALDLQPGQIDLATLPIFTLANLASGLTTIIPDADLRHVGAIRAGPVVRQIIEHRPTRCVASPAFFMQLTQWTHLHRLKLDSFTRLDTGGGPVFASTLDQLADMAPEARVFALYGSSEAEPIAHLSREEIGMDDRRAMASGAGLLAGRIVASLHCRVLRSEPHQPLGPLSRREFDQRVLPAGEVGEIVVSGPHVLSQYLQGIGDEQTKIRVEGEVWHRTGDAGRWDEQGRLWLLGRWEARIDDHRGRAYPLAVEAAAMAAPGVRRVALVAHQGLRVLALEPDSPAVLQALRAACPDLPVDRFMPMKQIPVDRRHNAKIDYPALRRQLAQQSGHR
jgi:acyl-CoA synthetase (AMP-forming)/AMP-acid ligase II